MPRPAQSRRQIAEKKAAIIEAAAEVFAQRGISATSMDHVAAKLGWAKGTLYNYFPKRDDLIAAVFDWLIQAQAAAIEADETPPGQSAAEQISAYLEGFLAMHTQLKQMFNLAMDLWAEAIAQPSKTRLKKQFQDIYQLNIDLLTDILDKGRKSGELRDDFEPPKMASLLVGAWDGLLFQAWLNDDFDIETPARQHMQALLRGLGADSRSNDKQE